MQPVLYLDAQQIEIKEQKRNSLQNEVINIFTEPRRIIEILEHSLTHKDIKTIITLIQRRKTMLSEKKVFRILVFILSEDYKVDLPSTRLQRFFNNRNIFKQPLIPKQQIILWLVNLIIQMPITREIMQQKLKKLETTNTQQLLQIMLLLLKINMNTNNDNDIMILPDCNHLLKWVEMVIEAQAFNIMLQPGLNQLAIDLHVEVDQQLQNNDVLSQLNAHIQVSNNMQSVTVQPQTYTQTILF